MIPFRGWQRPSSACCGRGPRRPANDLRPVGRLCFRPTTSRRRRVGRTLGLSRTGQPAARRPGARNRPRCASPRRGGVSGEAVDRQAPDGMEAEAGQSHPALILGTTSGSRRRAVPRCRSRSRRESRRRGALRVPRQEPLLCGCGQQIKERASWAVGKNDLVGDLAHATPFFVWVWAVSGSLGAASMRSPLPALLATASRVWPAPHAYRSLLIPLRRPRSPRTAPDWRASRLN